MKNTALGKIIPLVGVLVAGMVPANATLLTPGGGFAPTPAAEPLGASLVISSNTAFAGINYLGQTLFTGSLVSSVWANDASNPWGGLTFTYLLSNDLGSAHAIGELNMVDYAGFQTDVNISGPGLAPFGVSRAGGFSLDSIVAFQFKAGPHGPDNLAPGLTSTLLVIQTDALSYVDGSAQIIDGAVASIPTFAPAVVIPEPTAFSLALIGAGAWFAARKRRSE